METKRIYLAGGLFDLHQLAGNKALAEALETASNGRYAVMLPQELELEQCGAKAIRDADFKALLDCDGAVFQFDGTELDAGTVAEFMAAKFADLPAVALRTDFRRGGDRNAEPWNLMCSFYPRTESLVVDSLELYSKNGFKADAAFAALAEDLVAALDAAFATPALVEADGFAVREILVQRLGLA